MQEILNRIRIGTAQWGMHYGITNLDGKVGVEEVQRICSLAREFGIDKLDTSAMYGDAEEIIGESDINGSFRVATKAIVSPRDLGNRDYSGIKDQVERSLALLKRDRVESLLIHNWHELENPEEEDWINFIAALRMNGYSEKIGISAYEEETIASYVLDSIDVVQGPCSIYRQGFMGNIRDRFAGELQARSIFLQGLILCSEVDIEKLAPGELKYHHKSFLDECRAKGISPMEAALLYAIQQPVENIVIGVCSAEQLSEILQSIERVATDTFQVDFDRWNVENRMWVDPRSWSKSRV